MKRLLSIILVVVLSTSLLVFATANGTSSAITFSDVDAASNTGKAIYKLVNAGILQGDGDGTFRPNDPITRAELSKIVNAIFGYTQKAETGFADLSGNEWYYNHVLIAKNAGYIVGYDDGTFKGDNHVTREQACAILCRVASLYDLPLSFTINDPVSEWAQPYVQKVLANSMMFLEEGNTFRAMQNITRAEFSVVYANFLSEKSITAAPQATPTKKPSTDGTGGGIAPGPSTGGSGNSGGNGNGGGNSATTKPTATAAPTTSANPTATAAPTASAKPTATAAPTASAKPTATAAPTASAKPTATAVPTATAKPTATAAPTATAKPTASAKPTATAKPTVAPTAAPTEKPDYATINKEMIENLTAVSQDIQKNNGIFSGKGRTLILKIKSCIDKAIKAGNNNIIDTDFVKTQYKDEIDAAKDLYNQIMADDKLRASFQEGLSYLETDTIVWLANEFGIYD